MNDEQQYVKVSSHEAKEGAFDKCLLLYSGGLDTSVMLTWIKQKYKCDIVTLTVDIGQTADDLEQIRQKALKLGAVEAVVYDAKQEFANEMLTKAIKANADYQGGYALSTPLARVTISKIAVDMAKKYDCQVIAHGCTGKGNDQVRFESYITTIDPSLKIIAPVREWSMGRQEEIEYAHKHGIPVKQTVESPYSYDENMWGNTAEGGEIEQPALQPKLPAILQWSNTPEQAPDEAEFIKIAFEKGVPTKYNGQAMTVAEIVAECNKIGAKHAVGIIYLIEDRLVGLKVRGVYENPAATILTSAHKKLELLVSTREENQFKETIDTKWAYMLYAALWFEPTMHHLNAYIDDQNQKVTGEVTVKLYKGQATIVAVDSPYSLFDHNLATFERNDSFNQNASAGYIELYNLQQKMANGVYKYEQ